MAPDPVFAFAAMIVQASMTMMAMLVAAAMTMITHATMALVVTVVAVFLAIVIGNRATYNNRTRDDRRCFAMMCIGTLNIECGRNRQGYRQRQQRLNQKITE